MLKYSKKLENLPPYLFAEIDRKKKELLAKKQDLIDLGVGDPDLMPPLGVQDCLKQAVNKKQSQGYPLGGGRRDFLEAIGKWYRKRFDVALQDGEILALIGAKEGIAHFPLAFIDEGDYVLCPDPGYPPYVSGTILAGGRIYPLKLEEENNFLPRLEEIPAAILKKAKIIFLNYPNNPTAAFATRDFFEKVVEFAQKNNLIVAHDATYSEIYFSQKPLSFLEIPGAKEVGIEFHSLSKTYNLTGWRIGWCSGNKEIIKGLAKVKENIDSGVFNAIQEAGAFALNQEDEFVEKMRKIYKERTDFFAGGLEKIGWKFKKPAGTFYLWAKVFPGYDSFSASEKLLQEAKVVVTPGIGFGECGEGYLRFSLTKEKEILKQALERIEKVNW